MLKASWVILEASWASLEVPWAILEASWAILEASWASLETSWAILEAPWAILKGDPECPLMFHLVNYYAIAFSLISLASIDPAKLSSSYLMVVQLSTAC